MSRVLGFVIWFGLTSISSCTDLAAVYKHDILILRDADKISPGSPLPWESLTLSLPKRLFYPVGLTQDPDTNRLFVAEGIPQEDIKIFSLSLDSQYRVVDMTAAVKSDYVSVIEGMSYSPRTSQLYWTDSTNDCIYRASVSSDPGADASWPELIQDLGKTKKPRGLAFDPCNESLYWSERGTAGKVPSSVEMWDLDKNKHHILVQQEEDKNDFYQGLTFDATRKSLLWAVTHGDDTNSTCSIIDSPLVDKTQQKELVLLDNCYPFSLTFDEKYTYWADWGRQGIMRASRVDPSNVVKLVHTPKIFSNEGKHMGVYGLAKLSQRDAWNQCEEEAKDHEGKKLHGSSESKQRKELEGIEKNEAKGMMNESLGLPESKKEETESDRENGAREIILSLPGHEETKKSKEAEGNYDRNSKETDHEDARTGAGGDDRMAEQDGNERDPEAVEGKETQTSHTEEVYEDRLVKNLKEIMAKSRSKGIMKQEAVEEVAAVGTPEGETDTAHWCPRDQLRVVVVALAVTSTLFLCSTIVLALMLCRWKSRLCKGASPATMEPPQAVLVQPPRQVKRFGPKKLNASVSKSGSLDSSCSGLASGDGVTINIEDCCQMTLCETPCYTSVKKQGKSYKDIRKKSKKYEDNRGLLDDCEEI